MKSGLAALPAGPGGLLLLFCSDEENGCGGSRLLANQPLLEHRGVF